MTFESSVISYGSQTKKNSNVYFIKFESSVISYGSQTSELLIDIEVCLRVV